MLQAIRSADSWEEQTMGVRLAAKERIVKSHGRDESRLLDDLREGLEKGKEMVHVQLCGVKESLQALQRCAREVNEKYKTETKRLNELRTLRGSKEAALRRLRDKLRREKSVPKRQRPRPITAL
ncbi:hypothetical protein, unlikely [Trypanosoma congolense IL3000]|uniref:Uncharacterized protein n=1 Tax=Trypanosoma congolense (strain IL3000) TaxID=1068625 RepID=F9W6J2_TRYCI|nr:hypothetical protein, unlikely [Trypanosoma congolense IL3000]